METLQAYRSNKTKSEGFTLIETLVALLVFSVGILSIAMHTTQSMKARINTQVHSSVMQIATQIVEPLGMALSTNLNEFETALQNASNITTPPFVQGNDVASRFTVSLAKATDANDLSLLSTPSNQWQMPLTVVVDVDYAGNNGETLNFSVTRILTP